jgi:hypothetical protein
MKCYSQYISIVIDDNNDENGNDFLSTTKAIRSHQTSNVEVDVAWVFLLPQLVANQKSILYQV